MLSYKQYLMEMAAAAYHGSPHDFDKFKKEHIGSGEGNQAYGYGLYFADAKEVAEYYRQVLGAREYYVDGKRSTSSDRDRASIAVYEEHGNRDKAITSLGYLSNINPSYDSAIDYLKNGGEIGKVEKRSTGKIYHVILQPDEDEYLLWDEPLNKQSDKIKDKIIPAIEKIAMWKGFDEIKNPTDWFIKTYKKDATGGEIYNTIKSKSRNSQSVSEYLHSLGIRGIKYLDGTSRSKGKGNYNYVIFNEDDVVLQSKE